MAEAEVSLDNDRDGFSDGFHKEGAIPSSIFNTGSLQASETENKFQSAISAWRREFK